MTNIFNILVNTTLKVASKRVKKQQMPFYYSIILSSEITLWVQGEGAESKTRRR